jgi:hypothetical protein
MKLWMLLPLMLVGCDVNGSSAWTTPLDVEVANQQCLNHGGWKFITKDAGSAESLPLPVFIYCVDGISMKYYYPKK